MPSLIDIRRRLRSVKSTQQITKAMKMVAAAKLRRAQDHVLASVMAEAGAAQQPLLVEREEKKVIVVVVAGDRGLCGAFNTNVHRATRQLLISHPGWTD